MGSVDGYAKARDTGSKHFFPRMGSLEGMMMKERNTGERTDGEGRGRKNGGLEDGRQISRCRKVKTKADLKMRTAF